MPGSRKKFEFILAASTQGWNRVNQARSGLNAFTREVRGGTTALEGMRGKMAMLSGAALGLAGVLGAGFGIQSMITDVVRGSKELENFARTAGMSVTDFSAFAYGIESVGLEADKLADISKDVKDKIGDFIETGGGEFKDFFENIAVQAGITAEELIKMSGPDALIAIKKAMEDANVPMENQVFYLEAIANDASLLIPLLEKEGKAWKELAQNAKDMGVAISDLDHQQLMELNEVLKEFRHNVGVVRREIVIALAPAIKEMAEYFAENKEEIRDFTVAIAESVSATVQWLIENREVILTVGKITAGLLILAKGIQTVTTIWGGMNAAAVAMTGSRLVPWFGTLATAMRSAAGAAGLLNTAMAAGVIYWSGKQVMGAVDGYLEMRKAQNEAADAAARLESAQARLAEKLKKISRETGVTITSGYELQKAVREGVIHLDKTTGQWKKGAATMSKSIDGVADATRKSFEKQERISGQKLEAMKKAYKDYADEVKRLQGELASDKLDFSEEEARIKIEMVGDERGRRIIMDQVAEIKRLAREAGESGAEGWDQQIDLLSRAKGLIMSMSTDAKEVSKEEVELARQRVKLAKQAVEEHNVSSKRSAYRQALDDYQELVKAQKQGPSEEEKQDNISEKLKQVKEINQQILEIKQKQIDAATDAAKALDQESDGQLSKQLPGIAQAFEDLKGDAEDLAGKSADFNRQWNDAWDEFLRDGNRSVGELDGKLSELTKDRHIKVYVEEITRKAAGGFPWGPMNFAGGGTPAYFSRPASPLVTRGGSKKDNVPAMLSWLEYIQPEEAVRYYGVGFMERVRRRLFPRELAMRFATGGTPAGPVSLPSSGQQSLGHYTIDFSFPGMQTPARVQTDRETFESLTRYAERQKRLRLGL